MKEKQNYKIKLSDLVPYQIGALNYLDRNEENLERNDKRTCLRAVSLFYGNMAVSFGITILAFYGVKKGLESLLNQ